MPSLLQEESQARRYFSSHQKQLVKQHRLEDSLHTEDICTLEHPVCIKSIATGVPDIIRKQSESAHAVATLLESNPIQQARIHRIYEKSLIHKRHMAVDPLAQFNRDMSIRDRMGLFLEHAMPLAVDVCSRALSDAQIANPVEEVGKLVLVTSTGFVAPGPDIALLRELKLSPRICRTVASFMGCAAAMNGLCVAADYVRCHAGSKALVCCVELPSVNAVFADGMNDVIISSLFADGCAAMVVWSPGLQETPHPGGIVIRDQFSEFLDNTLDGITLGVNANGITCELSPKLPSYIYAGLDPVTAPVLDRHGMEKRDIDLWAIHPRGPKIIQESVRSLGLRDEVAATSWDILSKFGNMLSVSLPFVL